MTIPTSPPHEPPRMIQNARFAYHLLLSMVADGIITAEQAARGLLNEAGRAGDAAGRNPSNPLLIEYEQELENLAAEILGRRMD